MGVGMGVVRTFCKRRREFFPLSVTKGGDGANH
jgi:hypothetical protein